MLDISSWLRLFSVSLSPLNDKMSSCDNLAKRTPEHDTTEL